MRDLLTLNLKDKISEDYFDCLTTKEVCKKLKLSHMTLNKWKKLGLKYSKIGSGKTSTIRFQKNELNDFLNKFSVG